MIQKVPDDHEGMDAGAARRAIDIAGRLDQGRGGEVLAGLGRRLAETAVRAARACGYSAMCLDTLGNMAEAHALYESLGFREIPAYYDNPLEDVRYLRLDLVG